VQGTWLQANAFLDSKWRNSAYFADAFETGVSIKRMHDASTPSHSFFSDFPKAFSTFPSEVGCKRILASQGLR
jgi:hypothetical protein